MYAGLKERLTLLKGALQKPDDYKSILHHGGETLHSDQILQIRNTCVFLIRAYQIASEKNGMNNTRWKKDCCQEAVCQIDNIGFHSTINPNTVMHWTINFRKEDEFHHPNIYVANNIQPKPALFKYFPQAAVELSLFILNHLDQFTVEILQGELIDKIIPSLKVEIEEIDANTDNSEYNLMCHYTAKPPSYTNFQGCVLCLNFISPN